ncbi:transaldolase [Pseudonocardia sp. CNS-004]|nr:transaldolase [Pseudonocardia sp. CNS-004]
MADPDRRGALTEAGAPIWLDDLSRELLSSGELARLIRDEHIVGVTTNPTTVAADLTYSDAYDAQIRQLALAGADPSTAVRELTTTDVRGAADLFLDIHRTTRGVDGWVSVEIDPRLAHDADATVVEAKELWLTIYRHNVLMKIPATTEGLSAITRTLAEGISVNATLIFSPTRYRQAIEAFITGLELARDNGHLLSRIQSVASFFVSRIDTEVDARLDTVPGSAAKVLRGQAALANARLANGVYEELYTTERWQALAAAGATPQRPLWASTSAENLICPDRAYIEQLATFDGESIRRSARETLDRLSAAGIDLDDVYRTLENEDAEKHTRSWLDMLDTVASRLAQARGEVRGFVPVLENHSCHTRTP